MIGHSIDDAATKSSAEVTDDRELVTSTRGYPPPGKQKIRPFRQFFTTNGEPGGTNDMGVDG